MKNKPTKELQLIIDFFIMNREKRVNMHHIKSHLEAILKAPKTDAQVRTMIQRIRENWLLWCDFELNEFIDGGTIKTTSNYSFIVANTKGYKLTSNKKEIQDYHNSLSIRLSSLRKQNEACWTILLMNIKYENNKGVILNED